MTFNLFQFILAFPSTFSYSCAILCHHYTYMLLDYNIVWNTISNLKIYLFLQTANNDANNRKKKLKYIQQLSTSSPTPIHTIYFFLYNKSLDIVQILSNRDYFTIIF